MAPNFAQVSDRITSIVGLPGSPGRWRLVNGRIHADCSAISVVVLIGAPGDDWIVLDIRTPEDLDRLGEQIVDFIALQCLAPAPEQTESAFGQ